MVLTVVMALMADTAHTELTQWKAPLRRCFFVGINIVKNYIQNMIMNYTVIKYKNTLELISEENMNRHILNSLI